MTDALSPAARAGLWMIGTTLCFTCMALGGRELSDTMSAFEVSFFRAFTKSAFARCQPVRYSCFSASSAFIRSRSFFSSPDGFSLSSSEIISSSSMVCAA